MQKTIILILLVMMTGQAHAFDKKRSLNITCEDVTWSDVETLVQPHMSSVLYTALVMQGQSSEYKASEAAYQAMDKNLPEVIKRILTAIIKADC